MKTLPELTTDDLRLTFHEDLMRRQLLELPVEELRTMSDHLFRQYLVTKKVLKKVLRGPQEAQEGP